MTSYFESRFSYDPKRTLVWKQIVSYLQPHYIPLDATIVELGAGYCDFINQISAKQKYAVDIWEGIHQYANPSVKVLCQSASHLDILESNTIDVVFASNVFEHFSKEEFHLSLQEVNRVLTPHGRLIIIQPNYTYCYATYFDDYTHQLIFSHVSMGDILTFHGFKLEVVKPRFLPFSMKSKLPKLSWLIWLYLRMPYRPLAKQFLMIAQKAQS
ncbi:MAG: class I SAM-dependent methyltransferase [Desulfobacterales bacterium]|nr:class I SAM-dependent methyltransferase [Desulfobacterales bacterium]